jgi:hypothetical protein
MVREKHYKCYYCPYNSTDKDDVRRHEEYLHGCFRDRVTRTSKKKKTKPVLKDRICFARHLPVNGNKDTKLDVLYELYSDGSYRMYTDDLKYGEHLEIVYDDVKGMFTIKGLEGLREEWMG